MYTFSPYLFFDGNCSDAMNFYRSCFGGELTITKVEDTPMKNNVPKKDWMQVMYSRLKSGPVDIAASDWLNTGREAKPGNMINLLLFGGTFDELKRVYDKLVDGASLVEPLKKEFFGIYGVLTDKFGVCWMFQGNAAPQAQPS